MKPFEELGVQLASQALEQWLYASRESSARGGTKPIPARIRTYLLQFYPARILDLVRYKIGDEEDLNAAHEMMKNENVRAVTLIDIIVFRYADDADESASVWAHELHHVEQYDRWGVRGFATRYVRDAAAVEAPAYEIQESVAARLRADKQAGSLR